MDKCKYFIWNLFLYFIKLFIIIKIYNLCKLNLICLLDEWIKKLYIYGFCGEGDYLSFLKYEILIFVII